MLKSESETGTDKSKIILQELLKKDEDEKTKKYFWCCFWCFNF